MAAKQTLGETLERPHFSDTKTWQRARDLYVRIQSELSGIDVLEADLLKNHLSGTMEMVTYRIANAVDAYTRERKQFFFRLAIESCVVAQNHILLGKSANFFDLVEINEELEILIRQIGANLGYLSEMKNKSKVDKEAVV
jgi:hypothetical protein